MIKIENTMVTGWEPAIRGARNPMNSWDKSDTLFYNPSHEFIYNIVGDRLFDDPSLCSAWTYSGPAEKRDLYSWAIDDSDGIDQLSEDEFIIFNRIGIPTIGPNDLKLLTNLAKAGSDEAKFRRMIVVYLDVTAPMYWWKEADTYKVGTVRDSCSTMHKIHAKEFTLDDFSHDHLIDEFHYTWDGAEENITDEYLDTYCLLDPGTCPGDNENPYSPYYNGESTPCDILNFTINMLNRARELYLKTKDKKYWWQMIQLLPSSYNQRATLMLNYEVLANMYHARKNHKLDEWREFCKWIETLPYAKELIIGFQMRTDIYKPTVLSKDLITVNVCEDKDGVIELRRGVPALYLGDGIEYAQVRILVGDDQYIKGMCIYKDDMPEDCDVIVNTKDKDTVFKDLDYKCAFSRYSSQPLKQRFYENPNTGDFEISPINYIPWEDDWDRWAKKLPDTFLKGR